MDDLKDVMPILETASVRQLAVWWCELNSWTWPPELGEAEKVPTEKNERSPRRSAINAWIESRLNPKFINRVWNKDMTDSEHEEWWITRTTELKKELTSTRC